MNYFKMYLQNSDSSIKEIRIIDFGKSFNVLDFNSVCETIKRLFPDLHDKNFRVLYKDFDDDEITVSSDEELRLLNFNIEQGIVSQRKLYVKLLPQKKEAQNLTEKPLHSYISCDGCDGDVTGFRYKCIQCNNYDLCSNCEAAGEHSHHYMIRLPRPLWWYSCRSLSHQIRKILRKNGLDLNKNDTPDTSKNHQAENGSKKFPGVEKKLINKEDNKKSESDVPSASNQKSSPTKVSSTDEWTIVDKNDTTEANQEISVSFNINETSTKQVSSSPMASAPKETSSTQILYPNLPEEIEVIHHENPIINEAVKNMIKMGFSNQSGLLTYLLVAENGDINKVLEILQPTIM